MSMIVDLKPLTVQLLMSGHLTGVQARLRERNPKATFINCDNHSLNLVGVHAASTDSAL